MIGQRRPVKAVYGKGRAQRTADLLWQEAITASPITKSTLAACSDVQTQPSSILVSVEVHSDTDNSQIEDTSGDSLTDIDSQTRKVLGIKDLNVTTSGRKSSPWKGPINQDPLGTRRPSQQPGRSSQTPHSRSTDSLQGDGSLLDPPSSPLSISSSLASPIVASTPLPVQSAPWHTQKTPSHIRFNSADEKELDSVSDISPISRRVSSEPELAQSRENATNLDDLISSFQGLAHTEHSKSEDQFESTIANEEELHDIQTLLMLCKQDESQNFHEFVKHLESHSEICKLGEASFSEVYLVTARDSKAQTVYKVIPFGDGEDEVPINDVVQEVRILVAMSGIPGFVRTQGTTVVSGKYPDNLLHVWDKWNTEHESESTRPDWYKSDQRYCVIALENGGVDLEHFDIATWAQACEIFDKIVETLAIGEEKREFEHRDLHWGNVLIRPSADSGSLRITIIDYTLSRAMVDDQLSNIAFYGFQDRAIFEADGDDYQFEIYRLMRDSLTDGSEQELDEDWTQYHPNTNVLWLHYLVDKLLHEKRLKKPAQRTTKRNPVLDQKEIEAWKYLNSTWKLLSPRRRYREDESLLDSAGKVLSVLALR